MFLSLSSTRDSSSGDDPPTAGSGATSALDFNAVYDEHFSFVWRTARRLGVPADALDDAVQDVFVVVHGRLATFEGRSSLRTWLFGITRRVVRAHRPARQSQATALDLGELDLRAPSESEPHARAEESERARLLHALLETLDDDKREALVLADLEEMTLAEVAQALGVNANTVASRVRIARKELEQAYTRFAARTQWRP